MHPNVGILCLPPEPTLGAAWNLVEDLSHRLPRLVCLAALAFYLGLGLEAHCHELEDR